MAIALVAGQIAETTGVGAVTTVTATLPNNPATGNFVVAVLVTGGTASSAFTVKDSNNNSYTATTKTVFAGTTGQNGIWYLPNAPANATKTITASWTSTNNAPGLYVAEFSGVATSLPLENDATANSGANNTAITTPSITTTGDGDLLVCGMSAGGTIATADTPWTGMTATVANGNYAEYFIQTSHGAQGARFTQAPSGSWSGTVAAFKAAGETFTYFPMTQPDMAVFLRKAEMVGY